MRLRLLLAVFAAAGSLLAQALEEQPRTSPLGYEDTPMLPNQPWRVHDIKRPRPRMVAAPFATDKPTPAPSDAVVLFDGKDLSQWVQRGRGADRGKTVEPKGKVENGAFEIVRRTGDFISKQSFGDAQYHIEWTVPPGSKDSSQWKGNSGILIMGRYEIQVLDCWENPTYADGQAASIYGQWPPLVNACRKPGEWQVYDIVFEAPKFEDGKLVKPAYVTVFHNGVLMHHRKELIGRMAHQAVGTYAPHAAEEPLQLQDHDATVRFRNIWVRRLTGYDQQP